jgi:hypothetical protein
MGRSRRSAETLRVESQPIAAGRALARNGRHDEALPLLLAGLAADPAAIDGHLAIYEVAQLLRRPELALEHQRRAIALAPVHSIPAAEHEDYALLVPSVPGTFLANTPVELLFDQARVTIHRWYVDPAAGVPPLPDYDAVFVAAGESQAAQPALRALESFCAAQRVPVLNRPAGIARLNRLDFARTFAGSALCRVPRVERMTRARYAADGFPLPHIVRPLDSHAGTDLARIENDAERQAYLAAVAAPDLYVSEYADYLGDDGYFRKYRIIFIDGEPYPFHLAISPRWMVHYYNAAMDEHAWMRDEEHRFLADIGGVFAGPLGAALREVGERLALDYVGIDCAIDRAGKLLLFEADNALIVHMMDDPVRYGYKHRYVPRLFAALDAMVRRRIAR